MEVLEKILEEIEDYLFEKYCIEYDDGVEKIIRSHINELPHCANCSRRKWYQIGYKDCENNIKNDDWIPTKERLPEKPVFGEDSYIVQQEHIYSPCTAYWDGNRWSDDVNNTLNDVIAWRYLPDKYEGE